MKNFSIAIIGGGIAYFLLGGLFYQVLLGGFFADNLGSATGVMRETPVMWALIVSQLGLAALVTYVCHRAGVVNAVDGMKAGAIVGFLLGVAISLDLFAVTHWYNMAAALVEPLVSGVRISLGGAVIGWALGMGSGD